MKKVAMVGRKKVQKLNPTGDRGRGRPKKTWREVIDMDRLALGLRPTHSWLVSRSCYCDVVETDLVT